MGKTNYIALKLDDDFVDTIYDICRMIRDKLNNEHIGDFVPMDLENIHMTLCFFGHILSEDRKNKMTFVNKKITEFKTMFSGNVLSFDNYVVFGRHKNLLVATFKCINNPKFTDKMIEFKKMFCEIGAIEENYFTAHITLGKINNFNATEQNLTKINQLMSEIDRITTNINVKECFLI